MIYGFETMPLLTYVGTGKLPVESNWKIRLDYYQLISTGVIPVDFNRSDSR